MGCIRDLSLLLKDQESKEDIEESSYFKRWKSEYIVVIPPHTKESHTASWQRGREKHLACSTQPKTGGSTSHAEVNTEVDETHPVKCINWHIT